MPLPDGRGTELAFPDGRGAELALEYLRLLL